MAKANSIKLNNSNNFNSNNFNSNNSKSNKYKKKEQQQKQNKLKFTKNPIIKKHYTKLLILSILLIFAIRLMASFMITDFSLNDGIYHLSVSKEIAETGKIPFSNYEMPPPLVHIILAGLYLLFGELNSIIYPILLLVFSLPISYYLLKEFNQYFQIKNKEKITIIGLFLLNLQPLISVYSSVNYTGPIAATLSMLFYYLLFKYFNKNNSCSEKKIDFIYYSLFILIISLISLTKLNSLTIVIPNILLITALWYYKSKKIFTSAILFLIMSFMGFFWYIFNYFRIGSFFAAGAEVGNLTKASFLSYIIKDPINYIIDFFNYIWYFPNVSVFQNFIPFPNFLKIGFFVFSIIIFLPLFYYIFKYVKKIIQIIYGRIKNPKKFLNIKKEFSEKNIILFFIFSSLITSLIPVIARASIGAYLRLFIPAIPALILLMLITYQKLSLIHNKKIIWVYEKLIILLVIYCSLILIFTAFHYNSDQQQLSSIYESVVLITNSTDKDITFAGHPHLKRPVEKLTGQKYFEISPETEKTQNEFLFLELLQKENVDYIITNCVKSQPTDLYVKSLAEKNLIQKTIYSNSCNAIYWIIN